TSTPMNSSQRIVPRQPDFNSVLKFTKLAVCVGAHPPGALGEPAATFANADGTKATGDRAAMELRSVAGRSALASLGLESVAALPASSLRAALTGPTRFHRSAP